MLIDHAAYTNRLRQAHPAEKAGFTALCMTASLLARSPVVPCAAAAIVTLVVLGPARLPARLWLRLCLLPVGFLLAGGLSLALEVGSGPWSLRITEHLAVGTSPDNLRLALQVTARSLGCSTAMLFLAATTPLTDLIQLLRRLRVPALAVELLAITYRALFILLDTSDQMQRAQASRLGYSSPRTSLRSMGMLASRLFGRSLERAGLAWRALQARGYDQELRVLAPEYRLSPLRILAGSGLGLGLVLLALLLPGGP